MMDMVGPGIFMLFWVLLYLAFFGFIVYFMIAVLKFMKQKNEHDAQLNQKLDLLLTHLAKREE